MSDQTSVPAPTSANESIKWAAILPVQRSTHTETVIMMVCNDWVELVNLCHDPRAYLKSQQFAFDRLSEEYIEWELFSPSTITMRCGGKDALLAQRTASLLPPESAMGKAVAPMIGDQSVTASDLADAMKGIFHVEFATYTSYVNVIYYPSGECLVEDGPIAYKNDFADPVLLTTSNAPGAASFHTDIDPSPRARGQLAVSIAQDPDWLLKKFGSLKAVRVTGALSPVTQPIRKGSPVGEATPLGNALKAQNIEGQPYAKYIDVTMTGLSDPIGGTNNCLQTAFAKNGEEFTIVCTSFVVYNHALFETQEVIQRTVSEIDAAKARADALKGER